MLKNERTPGNPAEFSCRWASFSFVVLNISKAVIYSNPLRVILGWKKTPTTIGKLHSIPYCIQTLIWSYTGILETPQISVFLDASVIVRLLYYCSLNSKNSLVKPVYQNHIHFTRSCWLTSFNQICQVNYRQTNLPSSQHGTDVQFSPSFQVKIGSVLANRQMQYDCFNLGFLWYYQLKKKSSDSYTLHLV